MDEKGIFKFHFDGDIVDNHLVTARTLGKALIHVQNAFDRAYLDLKYRQLWKHARMKGADYGEADFIATYPTEGGFVQELKSKCGKVIIDRVSKALKPAVDRVKSEGEMVADSIAEQVQRKQRNLRNGNIVPIKYSELVNKPDDEIIRTYADRSINREIDQLLSIIRSQHSGDSTLEIETFGSDLFKYDFDKQKSQKFHKLVSQRSLGKPVVYSARVRELDRDRSKGKVVNLENKKTMALHFNSESDFLKVHPFLGNGDDMMFIGSPIIEYGSFDPNAGDVYFIELA